ncbi:hypothetical protein, partial [Streptococcus agalactiae]
QEGIRRAGVIRIVFVIHQLNLNAPEHYLETWNPSILDAISKRESPARKDRTVCHNRPMKAKTESVLRSKRDFKNIL